MIRLSDYFYLDPGSQVRLNHENCPAGTDTRQRWYIKKTEDGSRIVSFCHNCGQKGSIRVGLTGRMSRPTPVPKTGNKVSLPIDFEENNSLWPLEARKFILSTQLDFSDCKTMGLGYSNISRRLIMPVWRAGELEGYQARSFDPAQIKYITQSRYKPLRAWYNGSMEPETVVVCEDLLSAFQISKAGYTGFACLGSGIGGSEIFALSKSYRKVVVWLDNDKPGVQKSARRLLRYGELFFEKASIVLDAVDPKKYSVDEIRRRIK